MKLGSEVSVCDDAMEHDDTEEADRSKRDSFVKKWQKELVLLN